jgi:hypothetical protein
MAFSYTINFQTLSEGNSFWKLKELLVAAGWTVARSGDGLAAFSNSSDVLSAGGPYPITGANSLDNTSAWMEVFQPSAQIPRRSFLIQKTSSAGAWRVWYSSADTYKSGVGDSITFSTPNVTLTDATATFTAGDIGKYILIQGSATPANNGLFLVTARTGTTITFTNANGVAEGAYTGTWKLVSSDGFKWGMTGIGTTPGITNPAGSTFRLTAANSLATTATSGNGTTATILFASQNNLFVVGSTIAVAGVTPLGYNTAAATVTASTATTVSYLNATSGAQSVAGTVTPQFVAGDVGRTLRITGATSPGNNGDFVVTAQTGTTLDYTNASGVVEAYVQSWFLDRPTASTNRMFASDEQGLVNTPAGASVFVPQNVAGVFLLDVIVGAAAEDYSFFFGCRRFATQGYSGLLVLDVPTGAHAYDVDSALLLTNFDADSKFATSTTGPFTTTLAQTSGGTRGWYKKLWTGAALVSYPLCGMGGQEGGADFYVSRSEARTSQDPANNFQELPTHYIRGGAAMTTERGYKGKSRFFRVSNTVLGFHRNNVGRTRMCLSAISIPWDGATIPIF